MTDVQAPDGTIARFPDDMSDADISAVMSKQFPPEQASQGDPGLLANSARALRMGLPFGNQMVAAEKTLLPQSLGGSKGFDYGANLADVNAADAQLQQQHPHLAALGQGTTGALASLAVPGAALGEGAGAIPQIVRSSGAGFGIGALQGAGAPGSDIRNIPETAENAIRGGYAGGALGGALPGVAALAGKAINPLAAGLSRAPDLAGLGNDVNAAYGAVRNSGAGYAPEKFKMLTDKIAADAADENISAKLNPKASAIIEDMQARADAAVKAGKPMTLDDLDKERQYVNDNLAGLPEAKQARFGALIKNNIDEFINNAEPQAVTPKAPRAPVDYNAPNGPDANYIAPGTAAEGGAAAVPQRPVNPGGQAPPRGSGPAPIPLLDIMRNYGLQDEGGDLASMGFANKQGRTPGVDKAFKIIDKENGVPMDEGLRVAQELGYMEPHEEVSDFINKLGEHPTYSRADQEEVARRAARSEFDLGMAPQSEFSNPENYQDEARPQVEGSKPNGSFNDFIQAQKTAFADFRTRFDPQFNSKNSFAMENGGKQVLASKNISGEAPFRVTQFDNGVPQGHFEVDNLDDLAHEMHAYERQGYTSREAPTPVPPAPSAADTAGLIQNARDLAQRQFKAQALAAALGKATDRADVTGTGGNIENTTRQKLLAIRDKQNWSPDELAQLNKVIHGTPETNTLRDLSRWGPKGNALMAMGEVAALGMGHPLLAGLGAVGTAAQGAGVLARRGAQNRLMATILAGGKAPSVASMGSGPTRAALAAALATNANLQSPQQQNLSTR